jgi:hypothetical protein
LTVEQDVVREQSTREGALKVGAKSLGAVLVVAIGLAATRARAAGAEPVAVSQSPKVQWLEVAGGSWKPAAPVLAKAETALRKSLAARLQNKVTAAEWRRYSIQYQGSTAPTGHQFIEVNAFCSTMPEQWRAHFDLAREWVRVYGGGSCFFRAHYVSTTDTVSHFRINAPQ